MCWLDEFTTDVEVVYPFGKRRNKSYLAKPKEAKKKHLKLLFVMTGTLLGD